MNFLYSIYEYLPDWLVPILGFLVLCLQIFFVVDALRNDRGYYWVWILIALPMLGIIVYWCSFKWDGSRLEHWIFRSGRDARHLDTLETATRRIGNAANYEELGDELWKQRKFARAEENYRTALGKDPKLRDARARLGYCLLSRNRAEEAWHLIDSVIQEDRKHDHENLLWQAGRCQQMLGNPAAARSFYEEYTARHSYAEPMIELAEICVALDDKDAARKLCEEIIAEVKDSPGYVRRKEGPFAGRAKRLLRTLR